MVMSPVGLETMGCGAPPDYEHPAMGATDVAHLRCTKTKSDVEPMVSSPKGLFTMGYHLYAAPRLSTPNGVLASLFENIARRDSP